MPFISNLRETPLELLANLARWQTMWIICVVMFIALKYLSLYHHPRVKVNRVKFPLLYLLGWVGLDPKPFTQPKKSSKHTQWLLTSIQNIFLGLVFWLFTAKAIDPPLLQGWGYCISIIFLLHFGSFKLLAYILRLMGHPVKPLMNNPHLSKSVSEFWGKRWNSAFRDMAHPFLFIPLTKKWGVLMAHHLTFLISGLIHELAISIPAGGGYGLPTLYFIIQGLSIQMEKTTPFKRLAKPIQRATTYLLLVTPAVILFPPPFQAKVILPMADFINSILNI